MEEKSYRLRTTPGGEDKYLTLKLNQSYNYLDVLSIKINQDNFYRDFTSDYGVLVGRVIANGGLGIPNANVSIFIPLSDEDENNPLISSVYPFKTPLDKDDNGVIYNLLTPRPSVVGDNTYKGVGSFPNRQQFLDSDTYLEVYEKYYKYTTKTNESGDYMIFGVPVGTQTIHMDLDLSDIGKYSFKANTLIANGVPKILFTENNGIPDFKWSNNLEELPQIMFKNYSVDILPLWGNSEVNEIGISRYDFNIIINTDPIAYMTFNYAFSQTQNDNDKAGLYDGNSGGNSPYQWVDDSDYPPGKIGFFTIKPTISVEGIRYNDDGSQFNVELEIISSNALLKAGICIVGIPCYSERVITDEYGNEVFSNDNRGIGTRGKWNIIINHNNDSSFYRNFSIPMNGSTSKFFVGRKDRMYTIGYQERVSYSLNYDQNENTLISRRVDNGYVGEGAGCINGLAYFGPGWFNSTDSGSKSPPRWLEVGNMYRLETRMIDITNYVNSVVNNGTSFKNCLFGIFNSNDFSTEVNELNQFKTNELAKNNAPEFNYDYIPMQTNGGYWGANRIIFYKGRGNVDAFKELNNLI